jgi:hypothetical protein
MKRIWEKTVCFFAALSATAFPLNFCWESLNGLLYKAHPAMAAGNYVPMMVFMAAMDTLGITALYALTALLVRVWFWEPDFRSSSIFFLAGLVAAYTIEYISLYVLHLWHYLPGMPLVFGVGLFPLFQLSLTGLCSVFMARKISFNG